MAELILYWRLSSNSKKAIAKTTKKYGKPYHYSPRGNLLERLAEETGMTKAQVYAQLLREREYLLAVYNS